MKEDIVLNGTWYIPETNETLAGTLYLNKECKRIVLRLFALASDDDLMAQIRVCGKTALIKGEISTGGTITLYDCEIGGQHTILLQKTDVTVTAKAAFWNLSVEKAEELTFQKVKIDFGEIINWTDLCLFNWETAKKFQDEKLMWEHRDDVEFPIDSEVTVRICPEIGSKQMYVTTKEMVISQGVYMYLEYKESIHWKKIFFDIKVLQNLLTLGMSQAIYIDHIWYIQKEEEDAIKRPMEIFIGDFREGKHKQGRKWEYVFTLQDLTGNDCLCLAKWYEKYDRLKPVIELYESAFNYKDISKEMLFLNLTQGLETYHARFVSDKFKEYVKIVDEFLQKKYEVSSKEEYEPHIWGYRELLIAQDERRSKEITLKSRLGYLFLAEFEMIFEFLDYKIEDFIQKTVDSRNYYTHYSVGKEDKIFPENKLPYVNGILLEIILYYILKEIGLNQQKIKEKIGRHMGNIVRSYEMAEKDDSL